jgi:hypothetical protein
VARILFVAYYFAPENTSGTHRSLHFARALMDAGHEVFVIAGPQPSPAHTDAGLNDVFPWPDRVQRVEMLPSLGSMYMSWKQRRRPAATTPATGSTASREGATPANASKGMVGFLRHHLRVWDALPDHQRAWLQPAVRAGLELGRRMGADAVFASGPPWTGVMAGHRIARALGVPFIADFRDPWSTGSGEKTRHEAEWAQRRAERWEAGVLADATLVSFNSPRLASFTARQSRLGDRARVILNGSDVARQRVAVPVPTSSPLSFRHFGSLYAGRTVWPLVRALDELISEGLATPDEVRVELIGDGQPGGPQREQLLATRVPVIFTGQMKFTEAARRMSEPSVLISTQTEEHVNLIPTKLYDYLCTGNHIIVLSPHASASWDVAGGFARCHRLDLEPTDRNRATLKEMIEAWRRGALFQEASVKDTHSLGKPQLGADFVRLIESVIGETRPSGRTMTGVGETAPTT